MAAIKIDLTDKEMRELREIRKINLKRIRSEVLKKIGWDSLEDFCADVFRRGMNEACKDPKSFVRDVRDKKDPIFSPDNPNNDESLKAYV